MNHQAIICSLFVCAAIPGGASGPKEKPTRPFGPDAARDELKNMTTSPGVAVTLFASEPQLVNPADMDVDARGRVWITEGANYRMFQKWGKLRPEGDRIVILEDSNGDGAADKVKTFYQGNDVNTAL